MHSAAGSAWDAPASATTLDRASELLGADCGVERSSRIDGTRVGQCRPVDPAHLGAGDRTGQSPEREWELVLGRPERGTGGEPRIRGDPLVTARVVWALTAAESLGLGADPAVMDLAARSLEQAMARLDAGDYVARAGVLHALSLRNQARFESVNALYRDRGSLSETGAGLPGDDPGAARTLRAGRRGAEHPGPAGEDRAGRRGAADAPILVGHHGGCPGTAARSRPRHWSRWPSAGFGPPRRIWPRPAPGCWPTASATAGFRRRPRVRPSSRWPQRRGESGPPRTVTGWS